VCHLYIWGVMRTIRTKVRRTVKCFMLCEISIMLSGTFRAWTTDEPLYGIYGRDGLGVEPPMTSVSNMLGLERKKSTQASRRSAIYGGVKRYWYAGLDCSVMTGRMTKGGI